MFRHNMYHPQGACFVTLPNYISTIAALAKINGVFKTLKLCNVIKWLLLHEEDDIIIIFDQNKINEDSITSYTNNIHKHLEFKLTEEEEKTKNYLDLSMHRNNNNLQLGIYRKPTHRQTLPYILHPTIHRT